MKATKAWSFASLFLVAGLCSVSCGKDEGTHGNGGGSGSILTGGTAGASTAGTRNEGGGPPDGDEPGSAKLGAPCITDRECNDPNFPDLTCVTGKDAVLGNGAPPKGLCTRPCTPPSSNSDEDVCTELGNGALCYPFNADGSGYCVEGCTFGAPDLGAPKKCHSRTEFVCSPALLAPIANQMCKDSEDCQDGELCTNSGVCATIIPACLPSCTGDNDCEEGMYCDQSFLSGVCVTKKQTGKALGEPCTVPGPTEPEEPDECLGFCSPDETGSSKGHCVSNCSYGSPCSWNSATQQYDGACILVSSQLVGSSPDVGDFGYCDLTCNCDSECMSDSLGCQLLDQPLPAGFRGGGFCLPPDNMSVPYDHCGAGGAGAGGAAGAAGTSGSAGAAAGESAGGNGAGGAGG